MDDLKLIKKHYGEKMSHLCRDLFPSLLETKGLLFKLLKDNFQYSKFLCDDIVGLGLNTEFQRFIYSLVDSKENEETEIDKNPYELMKEVGYTLYKCETEEDIQRFKKYYREDEELCTFRGGRLNTCDVFFAVKDNADELKREDFKEPNREDEYGTSVISIQFSKGSHYLSIKNRYNHTVNNPDATFCNNLDNIIPGLAGSFEKHFDYTNIKKTRSLSELKRRSYIQDTTGKFYSYNCYLDTETVPVYFCLDNVIIQNGEVLTKFLDKNRYLVFEHYILDLKEKQIVRSISVDDETFSNSIDSLAEVINNLKVDKIETLKDKEGNKDIIFIKDNKKIIITIDNHNRMIKYYDDIQTVIPPCFLRRNGNVKKITLNSAVRIDSSFGPASLACRDEFIAPNVKSIGNYFLHCSNVKKVFLPSLREIGECSLQYYIGKEISLPSLKIAGIGVLSNCPNLESVDLPNLEVAGAYFLKKNRIQNVYLPKIRKLGSGSFMCSYMIKSFVAPKLEKIPDCFLDECGRLKIRELVLNSNDSKYLNSISREYPCLKKINNRDASFYGDLYFNGADMRDLVKRRTNI